MELVREVKSTDELSSAEMVELMFKAGLHMGYQASYWHPLMAPYIYKKYRRMHIIDLRQTYDLMNKACRMVEELVANGGNVLMVGTKPQAKDIVREGAERVGAWYVTERWLGGMLTNFETIDKRIKEFIQLESDLARNQMQTNTKREEFKVKAKMKRMDKFFGGVKLMDKLPDAIFVVDVQEEAIAVKEAGLKDIPSIALIDTNSDPRNIDYPIPGNGSSLRSIRFVVDAIADAIERGNKLFKEKEERRMAAELEIEEQERALREKIQQEMAKRQAHAEEVAKDLKKKASAKSAEAKDKAASTDGAQATAAPEEPAESKQGDSDQAAKSPEKKSVARPSKAKSKKAPADDGQVTAAPEEPAESKQGDSDQAAKSPEKKSAVKPSKTKSKKASAGDGQVAAAPEEPAESKQGESDQVDEVPEKKPTAKSSKAKSKKASADGGQVAAGPKEAAESKQGESDQVDEAGK